MVDLAGAERPEKAGFERKSAFNAMMDFWLKKEQDPANQTCVINFELMQLASEVTFANQRYQAKIKYSAPT